LQGGGVGGGVTFGLASGGQGGRGSMSDPAHGAGRAAGGLREWQPVCFGAALAPHSEAQVHEEADPLVNGVDADSCLDAERAAQFQAVCDRLGRAVRARVRRELTRASEGASRHGGDPACWHWPPWQRFDARLASAVNNFANVDPRGCEAALFACEHLAHRRSLCPTARPSVSAQLARNGRWLRMMALHIAFLHPPVLPVCSCPADGRAEGSQNPSSRG